MKIMNKDKEVFEAVCKVGHIRREHIESLRVNNNRINTYVKEGYMKKEVHKGVESFKLTKEGHSIAEKEMYIYDHYKAQSHNHDLGVADKYFSLDYRVRDTFKSETELKNQFKEHIEKVSVVDKERAEKLENDYREKRISVPDCSFVGENGTPVAFEIVTANYSKAEIQAKEEFCREMKMEYKEGRR